MTTTTKRLNIQFVPMFVAFSGNQSQSYEASLAIKNRTMLFATRHRWMHPSLTPHKQAGTAFTYTGRLEGWVNLGDSYILRWFTC